MTRWLLFIFLAGAFPLGGSALAQETIRIGGTGIGTLLVQRVLDANPKSRRHVQAVAVKPPLGSNEGLRALAASSRHHREGALLFLDLDDFKLVNDTYGHDVGDRLLREAGRRLETCVRQGDTVARLGGDEFVVMLEYLDENHEQAIGQARAVGEKILAELGSAYLLDGHTCVSPPSIGITLFKGQGNASSELLRQADLAMYQAKQDGRRALSFYHTEMRGVAQQ